MEKKDPKLVFEENRRVMEAAINEEAEKIKAKFGFDVLMDYIAEILTELGGVLIGQPRFRVHKKTGWRETGYDYFIEIELTKGSCSHELEAILTRSLPSLRFAKAVKSGYRSKEEKEAGCTFYLYMCQKAPAWAFGKGIRPDVKLTVKRLKSNIVKNLALDAKRCKGIAEQQLEEAEQCLALRENILKM